MSIFGRMESVWKAYGFGMAAAQGDLRRIFCLFLAGFE
jgi:hypothetical protein